MLCRSRVARLFPSPESCSDSLHGSATRAVRSGRLWRSCAAEIPVCRGTGWKFRRHERRRGVRRSGANPERPHVSDVCPASSVRGGAPQSASRPRIRPGPPGPHRIARADLPFPAFSTLFPSREGGAVSGLTPTSGRDLLPAASFLRVFFVSRVKAALRPHAEDEEARRPHLPSSWKESES